MARMPRVVLLAVCALILLSGSVLATHWVVAQNGSGTHISLFAAMEDASSGDTIYIQPGVYEGRVEFVHGVTVVGAGAGHTILRHGYGFEEVLYAKNVAAGRLQGVTIERLPSVLAAPAVVLDSSSLDFIDCEILGGQEAGVEIYGISAAPTFEGCTIEGHDGHGLWIHDQGDATLRNTVIRDNASNGILCEGGRILIEGGSIEDNALSGLVLVGAALATIDDEPAFVTNERWGIEVHDAATLEAQSIELERNGIGGVRAQGTAFVTLYGADVSGGMAGIRAEDESRLEAYDASIRDVRGPGVQVLDDADCTIERLEILACDGEGVDQLGRGKTSIDHATIARNGGDGIRARDGDLTAWNSIVAMNGGAGIRVDAAASSGVTFGYNNVWGNEEADYIGVNRRTSDLAESPAFEDPSDGDGTLREESPCIGAGRWGETIGAAMRPAISSTAGAVLSIDRGLSPICLGLGGDLSLGLALVSSGAARVRLSAEWPAVRGTFAASVLGPGGPWASLNAACLPADLPLTSDGSIQLDAGFGGQVMLDGLASHATAWGSVSVSGVRSSLDLRVEQEWPTRITRQWLDLVIGRWELHASAIELTANRFSVCGEGALGMGSNEIGFRGELMMIPDPTISVDVSWLGEGWTLDARLELSARDPRFGRTSIGWSEAERSASVRVQVEWAELALTDVALFASFQLGEIGIEAEVGIEPSRGPRFGLHVQFDVTHWLMPQPNEPPIARFDVSPEEPEAGRPVLFDASTSSDPDGTIDQVWWEFERGEPAIGERVEHVFPAAGEYLVTLTLSDDKGATTSFSRSVVIWEADTAPTAAFTWHAVSGSDVRLDRPARVGDRLRLDASGSFDPDGAIVEYDWDLQSDGAFDATTAEPTLSIDPFPAAGAWPVTLRVIDETDRSDAIMHVLHIEEPKPPTADFETSPAIPSVLDPVRLIDRSVAGDEAIVAWTWDFGDGTASRDQEPIHRFESEGDFDVTLTVTDAAGRSASKTMRLFIGRVPGIVETEEVWALVVGISDYAEVEDLDYASRDAMAVTDWLLSAGVSEDHIRTLTDGNDGSYPPATLVNVREGLGWLRQQAETDDLVLIHFSGHGYQGPDDDGDEADGVDEFLALQDTRADARDDTALRDDEFGRFLDRIASNHVLVFFDSCYSGGLSRSLAPGVRSDAIGSDWLGDLNLEGRLVLSASAEGEEAFESPALEHGVFTHYLLQGLNGLADLNEDRRVTLWELYEYVAAEVPKRVLAERNEPQNPQLRGEGETRVLLSLGRPPAEIDLAYCPTIPYAGGTARFSAYSTPAADGVEWIWEFGDGQTSFGREPAHVYQDAGRYEVHVALRVGSTQVAQKTLTIDVGPEGSVLALNADTGTVIVSLGLRNGIRAGDRFVARRTGTSLEVIELLDEDRAICSVSDERPSVVIGDVLRPTKETPCTVSATK